MLTKALGRSIDAADQRVVLLAPPTAAIPPTFDNVDVNPARHADLLTQMQRLRGSVYLSDGAVDADELTVDGLHKTSADDRSWHLLMVDDLGRVTACIWYLQHAPHASSIDRMRLKDCPLTGDPIWGDTLELAIKNDIEMAAQAGISYGEAGGWAVAKDNVCISEGLVLALGCFSLARALGDCLCVSTATVRHCSSTILRRLGGGNLRADGRIVPTYYDPRYKCEIELLRFDSRYANPKYAPFVEALKNKLLSAMVVTQLPQQMTAPAAFVAPSPRRIGSARVAAA